MTNKSTLKITLSNLRVLNAGPKLPFKMQHILKNLSSHIQVVIDSNCDDQTLNILRKDYKLEVSQFNIGGSLTKNRGILVLTKKIVAL